MAAYSELTRRLGFEYNGLVLHEYYFENLTHGGTRNPDHGSAFVKAAEDSFGTYDILRHSLRTSTGGQWRSGCSCTSGLGGNPSEHNRKALGDS